MTEMQSFESFCGLNDPHAYHGQLQIFLTVGLPRDFIDVIA